MTETFSPAEQAAVERVREGLISGRGFRRDGHQFARYGYGPITSRQYGEAMATVAKFAQQGDWYAQVAREIFVKANLYSPSPEVHAQIANAIADFASKPYEDVVGRSGPWAGRPSEHVHPNTLRKGILLSLLLTEVEESLQLGHVPGVGWCLSYLMEEEGMTVEHMGYMFPKIVARRRRRAEEQAAREAGPEALHAYRAANAL